MAPQGTMAAQADKDMKELRKKLSHVFKDRVRIQNFFRVLTNDACAIRHMILEPEILRQRLPLDNERDLSGPIGSLGPFDQLPPEIVSLIFTQVDLETLTRFRSVSRAGRDAVNNLFEYRNIMNHAPQIVRATLALEAGKYITLTQLDAALMSKACQDCGEFGAYLHVPSCERVCYRCFTENEDRMPLSAAHARWKWRVTKKEYNLSKKNMIRTIKGRYKLRSPVRVVRKPYMSNEEALQLKMRASGKSREQVIKDAKDHRKIIMDEYQNALAMGPTRRPAYFPDPSPTAIPKEARFQVVVSMPFISARSENACSEWGLSCTGCRNLKPTRAQKKSGEARETLLNRDKLYSKQGFVAHVMVCPHAQKLFAAEFDRIRQRKIEIPTSHSQGCALVSKGKMNHHMHCRGDNWVWTPCTNFILLCGFPAFYSKVAADYLFTVWKYGI